MSYLTRVVLPSRFCRGDTCVAFYHDTTVSNWSYWHSRHTTRRLLHNWYPLCTWITPQRQPLAASYLQEAARSAHSKYAARATFTKFTRNVLRIDTLCLCESPRGSGENLKSYFTQFKDPVLFLTDKHSGNNWIKVSVEDRTSRTLWARRGTTSCRPQTVVFKPVTSCSVSKVLSVSSYQALSL